MERSVNGYYKANGHAVKFPHSTIILTGNRDSSNVYLHRFLLFVIVG